jgi:hypothetical protein
MFPFRLAVAVALGAVLAWRALLFLADVAEWTTDRNPRG